MSGEPLWSGLALVGALNARVSGGLPKAATGVSIDTRTLEAGDLFVALKGEARDGHEFVRLAFEKGAAAAVVDDAHARELAGAGPLLVVKDVQASLERLGAYARARTAAYVAAITGSVGKTTTKEMARVVFSHAGATHVSHASYNNQWGVPLSLARMPAATRYGFFEIGMNHKGEILKLVDLVKPQVAVVTRVAAAHLEHFSSQEEIADAKAEIFSGILEGGVAIINRDDETYERLYAAARGSAAEHVFSFGSGAGAEARLLSYEPYASHCHVRAEIFGREIEFRLSALGLHLAQNALAVLLLAQLFELDLGEAARSLNEFSPERGRGKRESLEIGGRKITLIDESYNANPTSMRAAFALLAHATPDVGGRRIAVLGDMLELGPSAGELHAGLADDLRQANVDLLFTAGPLMSRAFYAAPDHMHGAHRATAAELAEPLIAALQDGDVVMIKGSNAARLSSISAELRSKSAPEAHHP
ncbi:MAG TPA: UDP-N-acetylmuramoyl-tripeptide--D-alanyl-D-alanine ligase [Methylocystis sp.]|nr:UDP-N-acetylmuramoyl-tripeptide--D-alanyl-D-alanine ligase [Methylocystis sp.]